MENQFRKCLKLAKLINQETIPNLNMAYNYLMTSMKDFVYEHESLNTSSMYARQAKGAQNSSDIDNSNVRGYVSSLADYVSVLTRKSRYLTDELDSIRSEYQHELKKIHEVNASIVDLIKTGDTPAADVLQQLIALGKSIQKVQNEDLPTYSQTIKTFVKKVEEEVVDGAYRNYNSVMKLDPSTFPSVPRKSWASIPNEFFRTPGAFVNSDYQSEG